MNIPDLHLPVARFIVSAELIEIGASLQVAAARLAEDGRALVVTDGGRYAGLIGEDEILRALANGADGASEAPWIEAPAIAMTATGGEALRALEQANVPFLAVVDAAGQPVGLVSASLLLAFGEAEPRPRAVGGMATPFGVYLTNGAVSGGVGGRALVVTGMLLFTLFLIASILSIVVGHYLSGTNWPEGLQSFLIATTSAVVFLGLLRMLPLTGYHAAEHMVVHAIERGEPLEPEVVARMPRVHPRCGTNLAVGASLFLGLSTSTWIANQELKLLAAAVVSLMLWRPVGAFVQLHVTTRPPSREQIEAGLKAGRQLLDRFSRLGAQPRSFWQKIALSGMFHIMLGSLAVYAAFRLVLTVLPIPAEWKVYF